MLVALSGSMPERSSVSLPVSSSRLAHLDLRYDRTLGILWKYISANSTPYFSHDQLDDVRQVQQVIRNGSNLDLPGYDSSALRYVVFGSKLPKVFSLGGDLKLFRDLIGKRDRLGLERYSKKATDAIFHHAANSRDVSTFSLVQGTAMGGGFEAALAGNVLVAERGVRLGFPEVLFGLFPGMGAYTLLRRRVDALSAEKIILGAKNYFAEELHAMGIVDILAEPGEGEQSIYSYISRQASRPGAFAFRRALKHARVIDRKELYSIADDWVDTAMNLPNEYLRRIDRLVSNQHKFYASGDLEKQVKPTIKVI